MSGGVDSSVAAAILREEDYEVTGVTMRHFCFRKGESREALKSCCSLESLDDARKVCEQIGIPHVIIDVERDFLEHVVDDFTGEYLAGRTPNPCIRCNQHVRFPWLLRMSAQLGTDWIATGHYARVREPADGMDHFTLHRGVDTDKDQSYFLWSLDQPTLSRTIFPISGMRKSEVRKKADEFGIIVADKADSQEICFIPEGDYREFLYRPGDTSPALQPGPIVTTGGEELGRHDGVAFYTIGQRRGLGIGGGEPLYVIEISPDSRTIVVGRKEELLASEFVTESPCWISAESPEFPIRCDVKIRYRHTASRATIEPGEPGTLRITFEKAQEAITPGQSAVFYDGDQVLGGGIIRQVNR